MNLVKHRRVNFLVGQRCVGGGGERGVATLGSMGMDNGRTGGASDYGLPVIGHCNYSAVITAVITCNYTSPFSVTCNLSPAPLCPPSAVRPCVSPCLCAFVSMAALRNHKGELITDANEQQIKVWARR